jgi:hypothetical protein
MMTKSGRYEGETFAHSDITLGFVSWISVEFKLYFTMILRDTLFGICFFCNRRCFSFTFSYLIQGSFSFFDSLKVKQFVSQSFDNSPDVAFFSFVEGDFVLIREKGWGDGFEF